MKEQSNWNGFTVHGDVDEIEAIISTPGLIDLDRVDIVSVLEADGSHFIVTGTGVTLDAALDSALANVQVNKENITDLAIALCGSFTSVPMVAFGAISEFTSKLNSDVNIIWGVFSDASLDSDYKVVLVGSAKS